MMDNALADSLPPPPAFAGSLVILLAWLFVLGTVVGSFLNVVAYRLPRRMSLVYPGSRCPACGKNIRWHDNVPVLGWFLLRGKCRDCSAAISFRYPLVEFCSGLVFVAAGWTSFFTPGSLVPSASLEATGLAGEIVHYLGEMLLLSTLLAAGLMEQGGHVPRRAAFLPALAAGLAVPAILAWLGESATAADEGWRFLGWLSVSARAAAGGLLGGLFGLGMSLGKKKKREHPTFATACSLDVPLVCKLALVGEFLGTASAAIVAISTLGAQAAVHQGVGRRSAGNYFGLILTLVAAVAATVQGRGLLFPWPDEPAVSAAWFVGALAAIAVASLALRGTIAAGAAD